MLVHGDITQQDAGAIVNAANSSLLPGGGVCGAIHHAGGSEIAHECAAIHAEQGEVAPGNAIATSGGRLKAQYVIHTVGPVWRGGSHGEPETLASCYRKSIRLADKIGLRSVAFPSISTGIFGYPVDKAAPVALQAAKEALSAARKVRDVRFVLFDEATMRAYQTAAAAATREAM